MIGLSHTRFPGMCCGFTGRLLSMIAVVGTCVLAALVSTWPLVLHLPTAVPLGTEQEPTVPIFNIWTLWWTADRVAHGFTHY